MSTAPIVEFGRSVVVSNQCNNFAPVENLLTHDMNKTKTLLSYFKNVIYINKESIFEGPSVDKLQRYKTYAWRLSAAIEGYDEIKAHFACHKIHEPDYITWKYIRKIIKKWWHNKKNKDNGFL